jgi:PAS domain S-box-containing protein
MDENGGILLANPATARIFGYDPAELIGKPLTILMPEFMRKLHEAVQTLFGDRPTASQLARDRSYCPAQEWAGVSGGGVFRRNDQ